MATAVVATAGFWMKLRREIGVFKKSVWVRAPIQSGGKPRALQDASDDWSVLLQSAARAERRALPLKSFSLGGPASVDGDGCASNVTGGIRGEENDQAVDFVHFAPPAHRNL